MASLINTRARYTPRFVLRPFRRRDVGAIDEAVTASLNELQPWLPWASRDYSRSTTQHFVRDSMNAWNDARAFDFAIRRPENPDRHVGNVSVWYTSRANQVAEIGYWVRTDETSKGVCTEATARVLQVGFEELKLHRVTLRIAVGNRASERVAEKLGFLQEGVLREDVKVGSRWMDHTLWGLLDTEWRVERDRYRAEAWT
jgi:ribosomal-protein-serine acetyltransferase